MAAYILLPALTHRPLEGDAAMATAVQASTPVHLYHAQTQRWQATDLQAAFMAQSRATVLLHPADAPVAVLTLPPLPAARRDAALRVVLEDRVLGDLQSLTLAVQPLGAQRFAVAYCDRGLLAAVQQSLQALGRAGVGADSAPPLGALAALLPQDSQQTLDGWEHWADAQGAGALPLATPSNDAAIADASQDTAPFALQASPLAFRSQGDAGSVWARWRWAAYAAAVCVLVGLIGQYAYWRSLAAAHTQAQSRINAAFTKALPGTPQVDAIKQMQRAASGEGSGTPLAAALGKIPLEVNATAVQAFEWRAGALTVTLSAKAMGLSAPQQADFAKRQQASGITVRWGD